MSGSFNHIVSDKGTFKFNTIDNLGDAHEMAEECFHIIRFLSGGSKDKINQACLFLGYPRIRADLIEDEDEDWDDDDEC